MRDINIIFVLIQSTKKTLDRKYGNTQLSGVFQLLFLTQWAFKQVL